MKRAILERTRCCATSVARGRLGMNEITYCTLMRRSFFEARHLGALQLPRRVLDL